MLYVGVDLHKHSISLCVGGVHNRCTFRNIRFIPRSDSLLHRSNMPFPASGCFSDAQELVPLTLFLK
jgi:hypothetical protein